MCGIFSIFGDVTMQVYREFLKAEQLMKHRGPDQNQSIFKYDKKFVCHFARLAINDLTYHGMQPFEDSNYILICNGEIYNYKQIGYITGYGEQVNLNSTSDENKSNSKSISDCAYLLPLLNHINSFNLDTELSLKLFNLFLDGEYSIIIYHKVKQELYVMTDRLGLRQLYYGYDYDRNLYVASEMKMLHPLCQDIYTFPAGHFGTMVSESKNFNLKRYYDLERPEKCLILNDSYSFQELKINQSISYNEAKLKISELFIQSVKDKLHADAPLVFLLSGGLDSSLNVGAARYLYPNRELHTFTIGFSEDSPDILAARLVANHCKTIHHECIISFSEAFAELSNVIKSIETFDTTTIRASTLQYMISKYVKKILPHVKVVVAGETADEIWRSYHCYYNSPSSEASLIEGIKMLNEIKNYDAKRADLACMAHSLEIRFPHCSNDLLDFIFTLSPQYIDCRVQGSEKKLLRDAFEHLNIIPEAIRLRTKAAFSDSTSKKSSWKSELLAYAKSQLVDSDYQITYKHLAPRSDEELYFRKIFEQYYPGRAELLEHFWEPNPDWFSLKLTDPSATTLSCFKRDQFES